MTSPPEPKKASSTALKARVETLEAKLDEAAWYIAELQFALKMIIVQAQMQQLGPMVQAQIQQQIMDKLNSGGVAFGLNGSTFPQQ